MGQRNPAWLKPKENHGILLTDLSTGAGFRWPHRMVIPCCHVTPWWPWWPRFFALLRLVPAPVAPAKLPKRWGAIQIAIHVCCEKLWFIPKNHSDFSVCDYWRSYTSIFTTENDLRFDEHSSPVCAGDGHRMLVKNIKTTKLRRETSTKRANLRGIWPFTLLFLVWPATWAAEWKTCHLGSGGVRFDGSKNRQLVVNFPAVWGIPKACGWCSPPRFREGWIQRHRSQTGRPSDRARSVWDLQETPWRAARGPRIAENVAWSTLAACRGSLRFQLPEFVMTLQRKHLAKTIRDNYPLVLEHFNIIIFDRSKSKSSSLDMFITRAIFYSYVSQNQRVMSTLGCPLGDQRGPKSPVLDGLLGVLL